MLMSGLRLSDLNKETTYLLTYLLIMQYSKYVKAELQGQIFSSFFTSVFIRLSCIMTTVIFTTYRMISLVLRRFKDINI